MDTLSDIDKSNNNTNSTNNHNNNLSDFDTLEKDFQRVLNELISDKSLEKFRFEYEKLHNALTKSHLNEKKLFLKCRQLNTELLTNNSKINQALRLSTEDQNSITLLKNEIDKAWKMVDLAQQKEKKAKRTIQSLRSEITNLTQLMSKGSGLNLNQETTVNELLKAKQELSQLLDNLTLKSNSQLTHISELNLQLDNAQQTIHQTQLESKHFALQISKIQLELERSQRRCNKTETELLKFETYQLQQAQNLAYKQNELLSMTEKYDVVQCQLTVEHNQFTKVNLEFDQFKLQSQELIAQLELMKEEEFQLTNEKSNLESKIGLYLNDIQQQTKIQLKTQSKFDKLVRKCQLLEQRSNGEKNQRLKLESIIKQIERDIQLDKREQKNQQKITNALKLDLKNLTSSLHSSQRQICELENELKSATQKNSELNSDLQVSNSKLVSLMKDNISLEKTRERISVEANEWHVQNENLDSRISNLNLNIVDMNSTIRDERNKCLTQQQLYENVRSERNLFCQQLNESQDLIAEMKRKFKILTHQIEQYKEETSNKDKALIKQHFEIKELNESGKSLEKQKMKKDEILQQADKLLNSQDTEIKTLRRTLSEAEASQKSQKQIFDAVVDERDILGAQLIRRNDELALLYDKIRLMESTLEKGELQYRDLLQDCRQFELQLQDYSQKLELRNQQYANLQSLKQEVHHLQRELLQERTKVKALSEELENPINVHRWRKLQGSDPEQFELIEKIRTLQKRLISKTELLVEKDLVINEKERLYIELKNILARQPGPEMFEQLSCLQQVLKERNKQIKANTAELNMFETQLEQSQFEIARLMRLLAEMKKKYFGQRKREQLFKEEQRQLLINEQQIRQMSSLSQQQLMQQQQNQIQIQNIHQSIQNSTNNNNNHNNNNHNSSNHNSNMINSNRGSATSLNISSKKMNNNKKKKIKNKNFKC